MERTVMLSSEEIQEIERHKYFLSERRGHDIGWDCAEQDWLENYGEQWRASHVEIFSEVEAPAEPVDHETAHRAQVASEEPRAEIVTEADPVETSSEMSTSEARPGVEAAPEVSSAPVGSEVGRSADDPATGAASADSATPAFAGKLLAESKKVGVKVKAYLARVFSS